MVDCRCRACADTSINRHRSIVRNVFAVTVMISVVVVDEEEEEAKMIV